MASRTHMSSTVHRYALLVHMMALVLGFGAVLTIDWLGLLLLLRKRSFAEVMQAVQATHVLMFGITSLLVSQCGWWVATIVGYLNATQQ